jgi:rubrerythrin
MIVPVRRISYAPVDDVYVCENCGYTVYGSEEGSKLPYPICDEYLIEIVHEL